MIIESDSKKIMFFSEPRRFNSSLLIALSLFIEGCAATLYSEPVIDNPPSILGAVVDAQNPKLNDLPLPENLQPLYVAGKSDGPFERAIVRRWGESVGSTLTRLHIRLRTH